MANLANQRFLMFVEDIYEDLELWYPRLRLMEAGAHVTVAGPEAEAKSTRGRMAIRASVGCGDRRYGGG